MNGALEYHLWNEMEKNGHGQPFPRDVIDQMVKDGLINNSKQAWRTLEKWCDKGWYEWGCSMDLGWKTNR